MVFKCIPVGRLRVNCYILGDKDALLIVDPGGDADEICGFLKANGYTAKYILLTHCHFDHILAANEVKLKTGAKIVASSKESDNLKNPSVNLTDRFTRVPVTITPDITLKEGDILSSGLFTFQIIETPGHTNGGISIYSESEKILLSGDTLFCQSIGRSDFPTGSLDELLHSIKTKLFVLPDDVRVLPGHDIETTIGHEKKHNPFI